MRNARYKAFSVLTRQMSPGAKTISEWIIFLALECDKSIIEKSVNTMIFLESTGKYDDFGVEVFEGDIVKIHETAYSTNEKQKLIRGGATVDVSDYVGVIMWDEEGCDYSCVRNGETIEEGVGFPRHEQKIQVIGNVLTHPELCK